jgi:Raf kinase inhibitor-like YbhB/YbcL family protein
MVTEAQTELTVASVAFSHGGNIPSKYTCEGENVNPPLEINGIPEHTRSLAVVVEDHDAPNGIFDHWLVWNIPPNEPIAENSVPGISGKNNFGKTGYGGPCPPSGVHRYFFKVYALDTLLDLLGGANKKTLLEAMRGHILASGDLMAYYKKSKASL